MNKPVLIWFFCAMASITCASAAGTNVPPRVTADLRDGSRVVGECLDKDFKFRSPLLGDFKLQVRDIRTFECTISNNVKLTVANGDKINALMITREIPLKTSFGKVELGLDSLRKVTIFSGNTAVPQREGLIGFWSGNGNTSDAVGTNNAILMGNATYATGWAGQVFHFESAGSYAKIPRSSGLDPGAQLTVEFWVKPDTDNPMNSFQGLVTSDFYGVEISNGFGGRMGVNFFLSTMENQAYRSSRRLESEYSYIEPLPSSGEGSRLRISSIANFTHVSNANGGGFQIKAGQWQHIAATYDGAQMRLYIDGQLRGNSVSHSGAIRSMLPESFLAIGSEDGRTTSPESMGQRYFKGSIGSVALYNRALSASEIYEDYEAGRVE